MFDNIREEVDYRMENSPRLHAAANISKQFATSISQNLDINKSDIVLNALASVNPLLAAVSNGLNENAREMGENFKTLITGNKKQEELLSQQNDLLSDQSSSLNNIEDYTKATEESLDQLEKVATLQQKTLDQSVKNLDVINKKVSSQDESLKMISKKPVSLDNKTINMLKAQHQEQYKKLDEISSHVKSSAKSQRSIARNFIGTMMLTSTVLKLLYSLGMIKDLKDNIISMFKKHKENEINPEENEGLLEKIVRKVARTTNKVEESKLYQSTSEKINKVKESETYKQGVEKVNEIKGTVINKKDELLEKHSEKIEKIKEGDLYKDLSSLVVKAKELNKTLDEKLAEIHGKDDVLKIKDDIQNKVTEFYKAQSFDQVNFIKKVTEYNKHIQDKYDNFTKEIKSFKSKDEFFSDDSYRYKLINNVSSVSESKGKEIKELLDKVKNDEIDFEEAQSKIVSELDKLKKTEVIYVEKVKSSIKEINGTILNNISDIKEELKNVKTKEDLKEVVNKKINESTNAIVESEAYKKLEDVRSKVNNVLTDESGKHILDKSYVKTTTETVLPFVNSSLAGKVSLFKNFSEGNYKSIAKSMLYFTPLGPAIGIYDTGKTIKEMLSKNGKIDFKNLSPFKKNKSNGSVINATGDLQQQEIAQINQTQIDAISEVEKNSKSTKLQLDKTKEFVKGKTRDIKDKTTGILMDGTEIIKDQVDVIKDSFEKSKSLKDMIEASVFSLKQEFNKKYQKEYAKDKHFDKFLAKTIADMVVTISPSMMMAQGLSQGNIKKIAWGFIGKHLPLLYHTINIPFLLGRTVVRTILNAPSILKKLTFAIMDDIGKTITLISKGARGVISIALKTPSMMLKLSKLLIKPIEGIFKSIGSLITQTKEKGLEGTKSWLENTFLNVKEKFGNFFKASDYGAAFKDLIFNPIKGEAKQWKNLLTGTAKGVVNTTTTVASGVTNVAKAGVKGAGALLLPGLFGETLEESKYKLEKENNKNLKTIAETLKEEKKIIEDSKDQNVELNKKISNVEKMREKRDKLVGSLLQMQNKLTGKMYKSLSSLKKKFFEYVTWQKIKGLFSAVGGFIGNIVGAIKTAVVAGLTILLPKLFSSIIGKIKGLLGLGSKVEKTVETAAKTAKAVETVGKAGKATNVATKVTEAAKGLNIGEKVAQGASLAGKAANVAKDTALAGNLLGTLGNVGKVAGTLGRGALKVAGKIAWPVTALMGAYGAAKEWSNIDYSSKEALHKSLSQQDKEFSKHGLLWHLGDAIWNPSHLGKYITYGGSKLYAAGWDLKDKLFGKKEEPKSKVTENNGKVNPKELTAEKLKVIGSAENQVYTSGFSKIFHEGGELLKKGLQYTPYGMLFNKNTFNDIKSGLSTVAKYTPYGLAYGFLKDKLFGKKKEEETEKENIKSISPSNKIKSEELKTLESNDTLSDKFDKVLEAIDKYTTEIKDASVQTAHSFKQTSASVINNINNSSVVNNNGGNSNSSDGEKMAEMLNIRFKRMREYEMKI